MRAVLMLLAAGPLLLAGCHRQLASTATSQSSEHQASRTDSTATATSYTERVRQTPVVLGSDSVDFATQLEVQPATGQLKPTTYSSRGRRATVQLKVDAQGRVTGRCGCESEKRTILSLDRQLTEARHQAHQRTDTLRITKLERKTVEVRVPYTTWYDYLARFTAIGLLLLLLGLYLYHRITRFYNG